MSAVRSWREERVDALLSALSDLGMSMSRPAAGELIDERVQFVAAQMRMTPGTARKYLTDDAISELAHSLAFEFVQETPGADLFSAPRDAKIPVRLAGRVSAGLAEAVRIRLAEREDLPHTRDAVAQLAHAQAVLGLIIADQVAHDLEGEPWIRVPKALLHRMARYLESAAGLVEDGVIGYDTDPAETPHLPGALHRDADLLRTLAEDAR
ncbi:hypothetical protein [Segeticoccus rhizosphaerae]|uniref:hypothetical protein n=1 Tax=Segeticoccus rhizosphaerae TaxID=1104777 RepID=UPI0010C079F2|nr:hypothetical protein [Ornithinicoccus soli]